MAIKTLLGDKGSGSSGGKFLAPVLRKSVLGNAMAEKDGLTRTNSLGDYHNHRGTWWFRTNSFGYYHNPRGTWWFTNIICDAIRPNESKLADIFFFYI